MPVFVSSDRSSCTDDGLLYIRSSSSATFSDFEHLCLSILLQVSLYCCLNSINAIEVTISIFQCSNVPMSNVNKLNFLSDCTSGVPPVIFYMVDGGRVDVYILQTGWMFVHIQLTFKLVLDCRLYNSYFGWSLCVHVPIWFEDLWVEGLQDKWHWFPLIGVSLPPTCFTKCKSE